MRVLLCLLSEQHVPNLLAVHHYQPDRLVLVESEAMRKRGVASNLLAALQLGGLDYEEHSHIEPLETEDDLDSVRQTLRKAYVRYPGAEWLVNVTGGTKPMSIATYDFFKGLINIRVLKGRVLYTNLAHPGRILDLDSHNAEECNYRILTKQFLAGYGFESRMEDKKLDEGEARARSWWECARRIAQEARTKPLLRLKDEERNLARKKGLDLQCDHTSADDAGVWSHLAQCFSLQLKDHLPRGKIDKYAVQFLTGGWLEVFLWGLLERNAKQLDIWNVRLGLEVGRKEEITGNDFDISFMRANGLCMVECKSGSQSHDPGGDILYKIEAVIRQFRAIRVQSWLVTMADNVLDGEGQVKKHIQTRAGIYRCRLILRDDVRNLAEAPENLELLQKVMFSSSNNA